MLDTYSKLTKGKESLAQAVDNEWGLDEVTVKQYICPALVKLAKNKNIGGIYYGDYMKLKDINELNEWIENAKNKLKVSLNINPQEASVIKTNKEIQNKFSNSSQSPNSEDMVKIYKTTRLNNSGKTIAKALFKQIDGLSNPEKTRKILSRINSRNIMVVMQEYDRLSKNENLIDAISNEYGLNYHDCKELGVKLYNYAKNNGIDLNNFIEEFNNTDNMNSAKKIVTNFYNKVKTSSPKKQPASLKPYLKCLGKGYYSKEFEKKTGVSLEYAILTDSTINKTDKINAIRNSFTAWSSIAEAENIYIKDIIDNANKDLQELSNDNDFNKYTQLYDTTITKLKDRLYASQVENTPEVNGKIDKDFKQGYTGDCWLLAAIKGISMHPKGLQILNDSLKINPNGDITVHLQGVDKTYTISKNELNNAKELSSGDGDVRAIEIAVNRYLRESYKEGESQRASIDGNYMFIAYQILTGKGGHFFKLASRIDQIINPEFYNDNPVTDEQIDSFNTKDQITCVSASGHKKDIEVYSTNKQKGVLTTSHAYTVTHCDAQYVYLINPWDTSNELKVDRKTFKSFFTSIETLKL